MQEIMLKVQEHPFGLLICFVLLAIGIMLLVWGGERLVRGGLGIAKRFNIKTVIIGLTIIAFSTSSPELAFNVFAASSGHGEITIGNIFGSNIANLALVLGVGAIVHNHVRRKDRSAKNTKGTPIPSRIRRLIGWWLVFSTFGISIITAVILNWNDQLSWFQLNWQLGVIMLLIFVLFFWWTNIKAPPKNTESDEEGVEVACSFPGAIFLVITGLLLLGIGGKAAELSSVTGARMLGISEMFIGVTIVAIATSLPELVTTIIAARKNEAQLAWGNIFGSNLFNILFVLPITMIVVGVPWLRGADTKNYIPLPSNLGAEPWIYIVVMLLVTLITFGMIKKGKDITDFEGYSLIGIYAFFLIGITLWKIITVAPV
ncbi:MAG: sodium:calcium antiporter [Phycisphaerae bacterium]|jgi:cation:H+ antiporter|nr:sodium:calcium antiporter [Phycisphaerae bacterium]